MCTEQAEGIPYHTGMDMNAITNQLRHDFRIIRGCSHHSRLSMGRYGHGIIQVGNVFGSSLYCFDSRVIIGHSMCDREMELLPQFPDTIDGSFCLRCNGYQLYQSFCAFL